MKVATLCLSFVLALPLAAAKFPLTPATGVVPAAAGDVTVNRDKNGNDRVHVHVDHLAQPMNLQPPHQTYVVWIQAPGGGAPTNLGELRVDKNLKGDLNTTTPERNFDLLITAENDPRVTQPSGPVVMRTTVHQSGH